VYSLRTAVRRVKGVKKVDGNAKDRTLTVEFDPQVASVEDIERAVARLGYDTEEVGTLKEQGLQP